MFSALSNFYGELDPNTSKFVRPAKFVFLCGGILDPKTKEFKSVRDFLIKADILKSGHVKYVLAEEANKLYESTDYKDLISFEEDIAKISSIILVITESPGSLAELGAFASYDTLRSLRLIVDARHEPDKSFIREGPIRRVQRRNQSHVGFFNWHYDSNKDVDSSIIKHGPDILSFINKHLNSASLSQTFSGNEVIKPFLILLWIIYLAKVISFEILIRAAVALDSGLEKKDLANKLFCLQLSRWIVRKTYSNKVYFYTTFDKDPFRYGYQVGVTDKDSIRKKFKVGSDFENAEIIPDPVLDEALSARKS